MRTRQSDTQASHVSMRPLAVAALTLRGARTVARSGVLVKQANYVHRALLVLMISELSACILPESRVVGTKAADQRDTSEVLSTPDASARASSEKDGGTKDAGSRSIDKADDSGPAVGAESKSGNPAGHVADAGSVVRNGMSSAGAGGNAGAENNAGAGAGSTDGMAGTAGGTDAPECQATADCCAIEQAPNCVPYECCDQTCVDTRSDDANCGACGMECGNNQTCCDSKCVDTRVDEMHCGACGKSCTQGAALSCCGSVCVDLSVDRRNCGQCGNDCGAVCSCEPNDQETGVCRGPLGLCF